MEVDGDLIVVPNPTEDEGEDENKEEEEVILNGLRFTNTDST